MFKKTIDYFKRNKWGKKAVYVNFRDSDIRLFMTLTRNRTIQHDSGKQRCQKKAIFIDRSPIKKIVEQFIGVVGVGIKYTTKHTTQNQK